MSITAEALVVPLEGDLCIAEVPALQAQLDALVAGGATQVVLDLTGVTLLTAAALRVLDTTQHRLEALGGRLQVRNPSPLAAQVLGITGLGGLLERNSAEPAGDS